MNQPAHDRERHRTALWAAIVLVAAWMLYPILTPAHVEGFSASIVSLALHLNEGHLADYDRLHPVNLEYFALSRLGTVAFMSALTGPLNLPGEWAIRLTTWLGFIVLAMSSFVLARRWTNASSMSVVVALLLIPGLAESSFFYNDTVFAAALGTTALAVLDSSPRFSAAAASGVLFGAAIVARLDAVLLAPAVAVIGFEQHGLGRTFWSRALVFTIASLVPVLAVPAAVNATVLDIVATTRYAISLWGDAFRPAQHARELSIFLGIPAAVLIAFGALALARRGDYRRLLLLVGTPLVFNVVALGKIWQSRQLLPLTPFLAALLILGWRQVRSSSRGRDGRDPLEWTVIVVCVLAWIAPVLVVRVSDGPRAPYGRLWTPLLWKRWQSAANANQGEIGRLVAAPAVDSTAIITDTWDGDRYLHLALQETGYRYLASDRLVETCRMTAELFARGERRILHIRLHQPFLPNWARLAADRLEAWGEPCIANWKPQRLERLSPLEQLQWSMADGLDADLLAVHGRALASIDAAHYSPHLPVTLSPSDLPSLRRAYVTEAEQVGPRSDRGVAAAAALLDAERRMRPRVWRSPLGTP